MGSEGGYANNPADPGKQTYKGVARKFWGHLPLWVIVDRYLAALPPQPTYNTRAYRLWVAGLNKQLAADLPLQAAVLAFYKAVLWDANMLGSIADQRVADWLYDHAVNGGGQGVKWMQEAAGVTADGSIGPKTIAAINTFDPHVILNRAEDEAAVYRLSKARANPSQIQFLPSWLTRDGLSEKEIADVMKAAADGVLTEAEVAELSAEIRAAA
jgi:lysozyme family protein